MALQTRVAELTGRSVESVNLAPSAECLSNYTLEEFVGPPRQQLDINIFTPAIQRANTITFTKVSTRPSSLEFPAANERCAQKSNMTGRLCARKMDCISKTNKQ